MNNLLKDYKKFIGCFSRDQIFLIENNKSIIINLNNSYEPGSHWIAFQRVKNSIKKTRFIRRLFNKLEHNQNCSKCI